MNTCKNDHVCHCGKHYKTIKAYAKHTSECRFFNMKESLLFNVGNLVNEAFKGKLFLVPSASVKKFQYLDPDLSIVQAKKLVVNEQIFKYRKMVWDIYLVWKEYLLPSEFRDFTRWATKTYSDVSTKTLSNPKVLFRYNVESTAKTIKLRINESILFLTERGLEFDNQFEFLDLLESRQISFYYIFYNDYLSTTWFEKLDRDQRDMLLDYIKVAERNIVKFVTEEQTNELLDLANSVTPQFFEEDF